MTTIFFILLMSVTVTNLGAQQNNVDSLKKQLESIQYINSRNKIAGDSLQIKLLGSLTNEYAESRPDSSMFYARQLLQVAQRAKNPEQQDIALFYIAYGFYNLGNYPQALEFSLRRLALARENKDSLQYYGCYGFIGAIYNKQGDFRKAISYLSVTEQYGERVQDQNILVRMYTHKGFPYLRLGLLDSALWYEQRAITVPRESDRPLTLILAYRGETYEKMGKYDLALADYRQCIKYSINHPKDLSNAYSSLARFFLLVNKLDSSIFYAAKAAAIASNGSFLYFASDAYNVLTDAYRAKRNIDSTFKYFSLMQTAKDSLYSRDRIQQMEFLVFNEQQQKRELEVKKMAYHNEVKIYSLIVGLLVLMLLAILLLRNNRQKQKSYNDLQHQKEETEQQKAKAEKALSELKSAQAQLVQSEKMASLGELTAGIAHEIQNPLNFVNNFAEANAELIEEAQACLRAGGTEETSSILSDIKANEQKIAYHGKRADSIVKGMLQHSRVSTGQKEPTNLNVLIEEHLRLSYHALRAKNKTFNATLQTDYDQQIKSIRVVPQEIGRVLLNLFNNAFYAVSIKKQQMNGTYEPMVSVSTKTENGKVKIVVRDNGTGMPPKVAEKAFQPFFTTKPTGEGTGLGLSLSYDIITKGHNGSLSVQSSEGEGSEFLIKLPLT